MESGWMASERRVKAGGDRVEGRDRWAEDERGVGRRKEFPVPYSLPPRSRLLFKSTNSWE